MSLNMDKIELEHRELFALEFGKIAEHDNQHQTWSKCV